MDVLLYWSMEVRTLPSEIRNTEHRSSDGQPDGEGAVVDQLDDVAGAEVEEAEDGDHEDAGEGRHPVDLDHGQHLRHLTLPGPGVEQAGRRQNVAVDGPER